jgi:hypothetical protein
MTDTCELFRAAPPSGPNIGKAGSASVAAATEG